MTHPYNKHDYILNRDLTASERLEPQKATLRYARNLLEQFENTLNRAANDLTEEELDTIARATWNAFLAAENACFLAEPSFNPHPLETVGWNETK